MKTGNLIKAINEPGKYWKYVFWIKVTLTGNCFHEKGIRICTKLFTVATEKRNITDVLWILIFMGNYF